MKNKKQFSKLKPLINKFESEFGRNVSYNDQMVEVYDFFFNRHLLDCIINIPEDTSNSDYTQGWVDAIKIIKNNIYGKRLDGKQIDYLEDTWSEQSLPKR